MDHIQIYIEGTIPHHSYLLINSELLTELKKLHKCVKNEYQGISDILHRIIITEDSQKLFKSKDLFRLRKLKHFMSNWSDYIGLSHHLINENCTIKIQINDDVIINNGISNIDWNALADPYEIYEWDGSSLKEFNDTIRDFKFPGEWSVFPDDDEEFAENAVKGIKLSPKGFYNIDDSLFYKVPDSEFFNQSLCNGEQQCLLSKHTESLLLAQFMTRQFDPTKLFFTYRNDIALNTDGNNKMFCNNLLYNKQEIPLYPIKSNTKFTELKLGSKEWPSYKN